MYTAIALFRGINVGGNNRLLMVELVSVLEAMDFNNIQTYIQSGNVVFNHSQKLSADAAKKISQKILQQFEFEPTVFLLDSAALQLAITNNPFSTSNPKALHFFFFNRPPASENIEKLEALRAESEQIKLGDHVLYLYAPDGIGRSKLVANIEKTLGVALTARNWNTVKKLSDMLAPQ